jgi:histidinol-phosphatase (PHP family)
MSEYTASNNLTNYHSHCSFCDGKAPMEDFFKEAVAEHFSSYGVSSHCPVPIPWAFANMKAERMPAYLAEFQRIKSIYEPQGLECFVGLEIDYLGRDCSPETYGPSSPFFQQTPLDYRIGSIHFLPDPHGKIRDIDLLPAEFAATASLNFRGDVRGMVELYIERMLDMISLGGLDFVGHCDKITYCASFAIRGLFDQGWFNDLMQNYFKEIAKSGIILEINSKHIAKWGTFFPNERWFKLMHELGIPVVASSDSHEPKLIDYGRPEALAALKKAGYDSVMELHGPSMKWQAVPIFENTKTS